VDEEIQNTLHREGMTLATTIKRAVAFFIDEMLLSFLLIIALGDSFLQAETMEEMIILTNTFVFEYMAMRVFIKHFLLCSMVLH